MPNPEGSRPERQQPQTDAELYKALEQGIREDENVLQQEKVEAAAQKKEIDLMRQKMNDYEKGISQLQQTNIDLSADEKDRLQTKLATIMDRLAQTKNIYDKLSQRLADRNEFITTLGEKIEDKRKQLATIIVDQSRIDAQATLIDRSAWDRQIAFFKQVINEYVICTQQLQANPNDAELRARMDKATAAMNIYRDLQSKLNLPGLKAAKEDGQQTLATAMTAMNEIHDLLGSSAAMQSAAGKMIAENPAPRAQTQPRQRSAARAVPPPMPQPQRTPDEVVQNPVPEKRPVPRQTESRITWSQERINDYTAFIEKAFREYEKTVGADRKKFGGYVPWQAFEQDCRQHIQVYYELTRNGLPTALKDVNALNDTIRDLNATVAKYQEAKKSFPASDKKTQDIPEKHLDAHLEEIAKSDWRATAEKLFGKEGRIARMHAEFASIKDSPVYKRFDNTVSQYIEIYKKYAPNNTVKDEKMMRTIVWEMNQMIDAYDEALKNEKSGGLASKGKSLINGWAQTIKAQGTDVALKSYFNEDMDDVEMRKSVLGLTEKEAFTDLNQEELDAALYLKTYLPELAGASPTDKDIRLNRGDIKPIAKSVRENLQKDPNALYQRILKDQQIDPRSEEAKGLKIILNLLTPAERAEYEQQLAELRSAPAKLQQAQMMLNEGGQKLQRGYRMNRPFLNFLTFGAINRAVMQGQARFDDGTRQYNDGWNRYQDGLRKIARLEKMRGDLPGMIEATIEQRLSNSFDNARVQPSKESDTNPRNVTEEQLNTFEDKLTIVRQIGDKKAKEKIKELTGREVEVYSPDGISMDTLEWMLQSHNKPVPANGLPPELALWINPMTPDARKRMIAKQKTRGSTKTDADTVVDLGEERPVDSNPAVTESSPTSVRSETDDPFEQTSATTPQSNDALRNNADISDRLKKYPEVLAKGVRRVNTTTVDADPRQFYWVTARDKNGNMLTQPVQLGLNQVTSLFAIQTVNGMQRITTSFDGVLSFTRFDRTETDVRVSPTQTTFENREQNWWLPAMQLFDSLNEIYKSSEYKQARAQNTDWYQQFTKQMDECKGLYVDYYENPAVDKMYMMKVVDSWDLWMRSYAAKLNLTIPAPTQEMIAMRSALKSGKDTPSATDTKLGGTHDLEHRGPPSLEPIPDALKPNRITLADLEPKPLQKPQIKQKPATQPVQKPQAQPIQQPQSTPAEQASAKTIERPKEARVYECQTESQFRDFIQSEEFVIVKFGAGWCGPCKDMNEQVLPVLAQQLPGRVMNVELQDGDYNATALFNLGNEFPYRGIAPKDQSLPTTVIFRKGVMVKRIPGFATTESLRMNILQLEQQLGKERIPWGMQEIKETFWKGMTPAEKAAEYKFEKAAFERQVIQCMSMDEFEEISRSYKPIVITLSTLKNSPASQRMNAEVLPFLAQQYPGRVMNAVLENDKGQPTVLQSLGPKYAYLGENIDAKELPVTIIIKNGEVWGKYMGYTPAHVIQQRLQQLPYANRM